MLNATTPLTTLLFGLVLLPAERMTGRRLVGLGLSFVGVACLLRVWQVLPDMGSGSRWPDGSESSPRVAGALLVVAGVSTVRSGTPMRRTLRAHREQAAARTVPD